MSKTRRPYRAFVVGGGYDYLRLLYELCYKGATSPEEADFVVFTGGEDVDPAYYGENALKGTFFNTDRDRREKVIFEYCVDKGIPMVGICRGGQFLNVMNDGKLWQDVNHHASGRHAIRELIDTKLKPVTKNHRHLLVTSTHHQMMIPGKGAKVIAIGVNDKGESIADRRNTWDREIAGNDPKALPDYEVLYYPSTRSLCFQPHPEFKTAPKDCVDYFDELVTALVTPFAK